MHCKAQPTEWLSRSCALTHIAIKSHFCMILATKLLHDSKYAGKWSIWLKSEIWFYTIYQSSPLNSLRRACKTQLSTIIISDWVKNLLTKWTLFIFFYFYTLLKFDQAKFKAWNDLNDLYTNWRSLKLTTDIQTKMVFKYLFIYLLNLARKCHALITDRMIFIKVHSKGNKTKPIQGNNPYVFQKLVKSKKVSRWNISITLHWPVFL